MTEHLAPRLRKISVRYDRLILDPNNPRFTTRKQDQISPEDYLEQDTAGMTKAKMDRERYRIGELERSIKQNGWLPVDAIFVRKLRDETDFFVVLEGNRRVCAIRSIMLDETADTALKTSLREFDVMEVLDEGDEDDLRRKISYLLGVRHHGSLKKWTPFAQAHNIFERYLEESRQSASEFEWVEHYGQSVADTLSVTVKDVLERLRVYRVMTQIGNSDAVRKSQGGMKDRYYSVCAEPLTSPRKELGKYVQQDPKSFLLTTEGADWMINLCHFDLEGRKGAPIVNPAEWRYLDKILCDEDENKRSYNLDQVEVDKRKPSDVWAERAKELTTLTWEKLLFEVNSILKAVTLEALSDTADAVHTVERLVRLVDDLNGHDLQ